MSVKCPTEKQYDLLLMLGGGNAWLSATKGKCEPLLRREWVTAEWRPPFYQWVRITPDGLRALALGVEKFGLQTLKPETAAKVCGDCGRDWRPKCRCGCGSWRYEIREVEAAA